MSQQLLKTGFQTPDGKMFDTKAEALDHMRRPLKTKVLNTLNGGQTELTEWMLDNEEAILDVYDINKIRRVKKAELNALKKALGAIVESGDKAFKFVADNAEALALSFRWPSVKRGSPEQQAETLRNAMIELAGNPELADWLIGQQEHILAAFEAGVERREVPETARAGLAAYQARKAAEKAQAKAAEANAEAA